MAATIRLAFHFYSYFLVLTFHCICALSATSCLPFFISSVSLLLLKSLFFFHSYFSRNFLLFLFRYLHTCLYLFPFLSNSLSLSHLITFVVSPFAFNSLFYFSLLYSFPLPRVLLSFICEQTAVANRTSLNLTL